MSVAGSRIETERLIIRGFVPGDWPDLHEYLSQESVVEYEPYGVFTVEGSRREAAARSKDDRYLAVCLKDGGKLIGNLYLSERDYETWELGFVFNANYQGMGYASESAQALIGDAFKNRSARRITANCNPLNARSWRLLERLGMRREGHMLKTVWFKRDDEGRPIWHDTYAYGILAEEWFGRLK